VHRLVPSSSSLPPMVGSRCGATDRSIAALKAGMRSASEREWLGDTVACLCVVGIAFASVLFFLGALLFADSNPTSM